MDSGEMQSELKCKTLKNEHEKKYMKRAQRNETEKMHSESKFSLRSELLILYNNVGGFSGKLSYGLY